MRLDMRAELGDLPRLDRILELINLFERWTGQRPDHAWLTETQMEQFRCLLSNQTSLGPVSDDRVRFYGVTFLNPEPEWAWPKHEVAA